MKFAFLLIFVTFCYELKASPPHMGVEKSNTLKNSSKHTQIALVKSGIKDAKGSELIPKEEDQNKEEDIIMLVGGVLGTLVILGSIIGGFTFYRVNKKHFSSNNLVLVYRFEKYRKVKNSLAMTETTPSDENNKEEDEFFSFTSRSKRKKSFLPDDSDEDVNSVTIKKINQDDDSSESSDVTVEQNNAHTTQRSRRSPINEEVVIVDSSSEVPEDHESLSDVSIIDDMFEGYSEELKVLNQDNSTNENSSKEIEIIIQTCKLENCTFKLPIKTILMKTNEKFQTYFKQLEDEYKATCIFGALKFYYRKVPVLPYATPNILDIHHPQCNAIDQEDLESDKDDVDVMEDNQVDVQKMISEAKEFTQNNEEDSDKLKLKIRISKKEDIWILLDQDENFEDLERKFRDERQLDDKVQLSFFFDGDKIRKDDKPEDLDIESGDMLEVKFS
ncbi:hypothetical protein ROZALSC1DRAFT_27364 [Rozella allomycis CSF55]|uniref:Rad60/SUMO-like domain-containing protein n=1 Tax=Rozella allomycis (strain CSF55) TaxID=988480 RepID=A0A075B159_ROZAC|nr:hypothetical protein O9G_004747 [Rozella allomycis CSF55]RKP21219.1 hypothetical protein ROZALSC1DRAFT_27364 [Rozella allomycis CSF55]|eukprot:EPZ36319.1 hypothetical protein O9G_004747 [Rozella allomycis CSF55]